MSDLADYLPPDYSTGQSIDPNAGTVSGTASLAGASTSASGSANVGGDGASEGWRRAGDGFDMLGKGADLLLKKSELGGAMSLPGDLIKADDANRELLKGDYQNGVPDAVAADAGVGGDVASMLGNEDAANIANGLKGGAELYKGANEMRDAIDRGDSQAEWQSAGDLLNGVADGGSALPGSAGKVGKALGFGLSIGNTIAPYMFGAKNEDSSVQTPDGQWHGSTGNGVIDWMAGTGEYSNSRWGDTPEESKAVDDHYRATKAEFETRYAETQALAAANPDDPDAQAQLERLDFVKRFGG